MNDIYKAYENVLLHFDGTNNSTTFTDDAGHTITANGNAKISTAQSKFGGSSGYFDGTSGTYLSLPATKDFNFGTDDLTIEGWIYPIGGGSPLLNSQNSSNLLNFFLDSSTSARLLLNGSNAITGITLQANTWQHIAITKSGIIWRVFVNGVLSGSPFTMSSNYTFDCSANTYIGGYNGGHYFNGYVDEFRLIKGYCFYTQSFSVPTSPYVYRNNAVLFMKFDGTNGSNVFIEETGKAITAGGSAVLSTTQSKSNGASGYFNGSSWLELDYNSIFDPGSSDWTCELWLYCVSYNTASGSHLCGTYSWASEGGTNNGGWQIGLNQNTGYVSLGWGSGGGWTTIVTTTTAPPLNVWSHLAICKSGSNWTIYLNGVSIGTASYSTPVTYTKTKFKIGSAYNSGTGNYYFYNGYIDDLVILKGVSRYSSNFDPSATDYYFSNDIFLTHCDGSNNSTAFVDEVGNVITANGNAKISTAQSKFGGSSGYFDGSNSFLTSNVTPIANQSYTIECWIYPAAYSSDASWGRYVYSQYDNGVDFGNRFILGFPENNSHKLQCFHASGGGNLLSTSDIPLNTWTHIATTYDGSTRRLFVNGVLEASVSTSGASLSTASVRIGCVYYGANIGFFSGYIDEIRVTKGVARYLTNFNVPFDAFVYLASSRTYLAFLNDLLTCAPSAIAGSVVGKFTPDYPVTSPSYYDGGTLVVSGTITYNGVPASRKVSLFTLKDKRLIAETWSDPVTGAYSFSRLKDQEYFVWSEDYLRVFTPVSQTTFDQTNMAFSEQSRFDPKLFTGSGSIWGTVLDGDSNTVPSRVLLLEDQTYIIIKKVIPDPITGYYEFSGLNTSKIFSLVCEADRPVSPYNDIIRAKVLAT